MEPVLIEVVENTVDESIMKGSTIAFLLVKHWFLDVMELLCVFNVRPMGNTTILTKKVTMK